MTTETTILDFHLSNTYEEYELHMHAKNSSQCLKKWTLKHFILVNHEIILKGQL